MLSGGSELVYAPPEGRLCRERMPAHSAPHPGTTIEAFQIEAFLLVLTYNEISLGLLCLYIGNASRFCKTKLQGSACMSVCLYALMREREREREGEHTKGDI